MFTPPTFSDPKIVRIVAGKTYAAELELPSLTWLDNYFAINHEHRVIVSPYFDYRQLSNMKITQLAGLINNLRKQ